MPFQLYTVNHLTHPLSDISKAADYAHFHEQAWRDTPGVHSLVTLSTCNRVEVYVSADPAVRLLPTREEDEAALYSEGSLDTSPPAHTSRWDAAPRPSSGSALSWNYREGREVAEHLYRVAAGLDSMVVGEAEIAGQVRRAFTRAQTNDSVNGLMVRMFEGALATSRRVSTQTSLTGLGRSVVSVALDLVADSPDSQLWPQLRAVLLGTGAYAGTTVQQLRARGVNTIATIETSTRAVEFARTHATALLPKHDLVDSIAEADLVVGCRGVGETLLTKDLVAQALRRREILARENTALPKNLAARLATGLPDADHVNHRKLVLLDLALHNDIDPAVRGLTPVTLYNLEDIRHRVPALAVSQIHQANEIVENGLQEYDHAVAARHLDPAIIQLRTVFAAAAAAEIAKLPAGETIPREAAEKAIHRVVAKLAHTPTVSAHLAAEAGLGSQWVKALATVWGLTPEILEDAFPD